MDLVLPLTPLVLALPPIIVAVWLVLGLYRARRRVALLEEAVELLPGAYALWDRNDRLIASNAAYRGLHAEAFAVLGRNCGYADIARFALRQVVPPDQLEAAVRERVAAQRRGDRRPQDRAYPGGVWWRVTKSVLADGAVSGVALDVTELKRREQELAIAQEVARLGTWRLDDDDGFTTGGQTLPLHGFAAAEVPDLATLWQRVPAGERDMLFGRVAAAREQGRSVRAHCRLQHPSQGQRFLEMTINPELAETGLSRGLFAVVQDVTERKQQEHRLEQLAYHDPLTGLANRALFQREARRRLAQADLGDRRAALLLIDVDHFKEVNDTLGHDVGDELLIRIGEQMRGSIRARDFLARLGGDEFAIILDDARSLALVDEVATRLQAAACRPFAVADIEVRVSLSIGIVIAKKDGDDLETLLRNADLALYRVKDQGRGSHEFFDQSMFEATRKRHDLGRALRAALAADELYLDYQPQLDLADRRVVGCEALLRWHSPVFGQVAPAEFIPIAESSSLIGELGSWVLRRACREVAEWRAAELATLGVSVNVSAAQFSQLDMVEEVGEALRLSGLAPERLTLELTESLFLDRGRDRAIVALEAISRLGVKLAIDDFGTGYSALAYLRDLPFDELKIDRSFIRDCVENERRRSLVEGIVRLAHGIAMRVVAEGIETDEQASLVTALGCDRAQGFLFARPMPATGLVSTVRQLSAANDLVPSGAEDAAPGQSHAREPAATAPRWPRGAACAPRAAGRAL